LWYFCQLLLLDTNYAKMSSTGISGPIFIFDSTRLRSHLFFRWVSTSPNVQPIYHPYLMAAMFGPQRLGKQMHHSEARRKELEEDLVPLYGDDTYDSCTRQFVRAVDDARTRGRVPVSNEHWFNVLENDIVHDLLRDKIETPKQLGKNPTYLPDSIFNSVTPIILIRHPIHSIDSIYRTAIRVTQQRPGDEDFELITMNKPLRILFDYFTQQRNQQPIVVDGDDILWRTDEVASKLAGVLGLGQLNEAWEPTPAEQIEQMNPIVYKITEDVQLSTGIQRPDGQQADEPDIDGAVENWSAKYGKGVAEQLKKLVEDNMPHYLYLREYKV
jgi:hypothetical protein